MMNEQWRKQNLSGEVFIFMQKARLIERVLYKSVAQK